MASGAKRITLYLTPKQRQAFEEAEDRERLCLREWLIAAAELAWVRGSTR